MGQCQVGGHSPAQLPGAGRASRKGVAKPRVGGAEPGQDWLGRSAGQGRSPGGVGVRSLRRADPVCPRTRRHLMESKWLFPHVENF